MSSEGNSNPELISFILGSSHLVIFPMNISAIMGPVSFNSLSAICGKLYAITTEPIVSGICTAPIAFFSSSAFSGASVAPKSTVFSINCFTPPPLPID